jgi:hypothetical protein
MFQIILGTSKTVSGTQNLERNVPNTAHTNVPTNSVLLGILYLLVFPVTSTGSGWDLLDCDDNMVGTDIGLLCHCNEARLGLLLGKT